MWYLEKYFVETWFALNKDDGEVLNVGQISLFVKRQILKHQRILIQPKFSTKSSYNIY